MSEQSRIVNAMPFFEPADIASLVEGFRKVLENKLTLGPLVKEFETGFAAITGVKHAVAVHSATNALELVFRACLPAGGEVIVPADTFVATANAVILAGGRPVVADISGKTLSLSLETVKSSAGPRTCGIALVHMMGLISPEVFAIRDLCREKGWFLVEDAAHAHGASINGRSAGSLGDAGCFSFYPTKVMTTGEGGMITTDSDEIASFAKSFRHHGMGDNFENCIRPGSNYRMDEFRALIGLQQLRRLNESIARRRAIAAKYNSAFDGIAGLSVLKEPEGVKSSYWKYPLFFESGSLKTRVADGLAGAGIETGTPYSPLVHQHRYYREKYGYSNGDMPVAEQLVNKYLCLPLHCGLKDADIEMVIAKVLRLRGDYA